MNDLFPHHDYGKTIWTLDENGQAKKREGLDRIEETASDWLCWVRKEAMKISRERGEVSADDLRRICDRENKQPHHQNAWGAVFRGTDWEMIGRKTSSTDSAHAREIKIWRFVGDRF